MSEFLSDDEIHPFPATGSNSGVATVGADEVTLQGADTGDTFTWEEVPPEVECFDDLHEVLGSYVEERDLIVWASNAKALGLARPIAGMRVENRYALPVSDFFHLAGNAWYVLDVRRFAAQGALVLSGPIKSDRMFFRPVTKYEVVVLNDEPPSTRFLMGSTGSFATKSAGDPAPAECSSTEHESGIHAALRILLRDAEHEEFEAGVESSFEHELTLLLSSAGDAAFTDLRELLRTEARSNEVVAETLAVLSRLENRVTRGSRLSLLHEYLSSPSIVVRDAAVMGIAEMDDEESVPYLRQARQTETCPPLRDEMDSVLAALLE